ncbi:hypothetical protein NM688_g6791 [Phlebia brevispora]|uniref:Uncharacterized protein n=1 Tax=Phlebia brevispora TaxID=194682 RepID=A0ACC1SCQ0_9APHY|nr:hypothetical protein NM688_g6791 [Phlebia brevispora]
MSSSTQIPKTQKAWVAVRRGKPSDALICDENAKVPSNLEPGEILVKVQAAALNPVGYKLMGLLPNLFAKRPHVVEHDFTGLVVDANGTELQNGDAVYGIIPVPLNLQSHQGALAQYIRLPASHVVPRPSELKPTEAAGLTLVGLTAYQALFDVAKLEQGQHLFINGGSTAVGISAIQLAKAIGCTVTVSASGKREPLLRSLGADHFIDYTKGPVHEQLSHDPPSPKFHVIFETVGATDVDLYTHSEKYLAPGGIFVSVGIHPHGISGFGQALRYIWELTRPSFLGGTKRTWKWFSLSFKRENFENFAQYVIDGKVKPVVDSVYSYEDVLKAYERIMSLRAAGKVVVKVDPSVD